jgi:hypothetical protein
LRTVRQKHATRPAPLLTINNWQLKELPRPWWNY